jgi:ABC-type transport system involved in cytochrome c biogenesis permease subunit
MAHLENNLFFLAFLLYLLSSILYLAFFWFKADRSHCAGLVIFVLAFTMHTAALAARIMEGGRLPFANLYEFLLVFSWGLAVIFLFGCWRYKIYFTGVLVLPLEILLLGYALTVKTGAAPLVPALQSIWLQFHVAAAIFAYGLFALSFAASAMYLIQRGKDDIFMPAKSLDSLIYKLIATGFPFMTLVIITGAIWAEEAWGTWWSWDPKETWALVTWLIYALYLHFRRSRQWSGRAAAWVSLAGFAAVIFTLVGITLLMPGAHSY